MSSNSPSLLHRSLHALKWNYLGTLVRIATQFILGIVLARLLGGSATFNECACQRTFCFHK